MVERQYAGMVLPEAWHYAAEEGARTELEQFDRELPAAIVSDSFQE